MFIRHKFLIISTLIHIQMQCFWSVTCGRERWDEEARLTTYLHHTDVWPLVFHRFTSLLTSCTVAAEPRDSPPRHSGKATSACLMSRSERRAADVTRGEKAETNVFPLISRRAGIDFKRHTGESHFLRGLIQHFNLPRLSSPKSKKL